MLIELAGPVAVRLQGKPNFELIRHDVVEPILLEVRVMDALLPRFPLSHLSGSAERSPPCELLTQSSVPGGPNLSSCLPGIASALQVQPSEDDQG